MERSQFWQTGTTGDGTTAISEAQTTAFFGAVLTRAGVNSTSPSTAAGVLAGVGGELATTAGSGQVQVATGAALCEGFYYVNDAALNIAIPTPAAATRIDRIVLRASHGATRTVRLTRIAGTEGTGSPPALTQSAGTTWDIPIANVSVTTGGTITVSDQRTTARFATRLDRSDITGGTNTRVPYFDANGRLTDDAALTYDGANDRLAVGGDGTPIGGALTARAPVAKASGSFQVIAAFGSNDASSPIRMYIGVIPGGSPVIVVDVVDDATNYPLVLGTAGGASKIGVKKNNPVYDLDVGGQIGCSPASALPPFVLSVNAQNQRVSKLKADAVSTLNLTRQSGGVQWGASSGGGAGTTNDTNPGQPRMAVGAIGFAWPGGSPSTGLITVTFPVAFSNVPNVIVSAVNLLTQPDAFLVIRNVTTTQFTAVAYTANGASPSAGAAGQMNWQAVGPE